MLGRLEGVWEDALDNGVDEVALATANDAQMAAQLCSRTQGLGNPEEKQVERWEEVESSKNRKRRIARTHKI